MSSKTNNKAGLSFSLKLSILYAIFFVIGSIGLFVFAYYLIGGLVEQREREIIRDRIQAHGGTVKVESQLDKGTTFVIRLARAK